MFQAPTEGLLFVISGPSGSGKETIINHLTRPEGQPLQRVVTYTTRERREEEAEGHPYRFISEEEFKAMALSGLLLEFSRTYMSHAYGSPSSVVTPSSTDEVMELDPAGYVYLKQRAKRPVVGIFVVPPDLSALRNRIQDRSMTGDIEVRIEVAEKQLNWAPLYDYCVVNEDLQTALADVDRIVRTVRASHVAREQLGILLRRIAEEDLGIS